MRATMRSLPPRPVWAYEIGQADPRLVRWAMRSNSPLDLAVARGHCCPNKCLWFRIPRSRCSGWRADRSAVQSVSIHAPHAGRHQVGQTVTLTQSKSRPPISHTPNCSSMWTASKQHTTACSIPNRHTIPFGASIPNCYSRHPRRPTASTVCKKPDLPLRCHAVAMVLATPPRRRISQAILEQERLRKSFRRLLLQDSILGAVRTVPCLPASKGNHRDLAGWHFSLQRQN